MTYSEPRRHGRPVEDNAPPSIYGVAPQVHPSQHDSAEHMLLVSERIVRPREESRLAGVHGAGPVVGAEHDCGRRRVRRVFGSGKDHGGRDDARDADEVADEVPLAVEEVGERGPEERGHDADGRHARGVVVQLRHGVLGRRVALHVQGHQRVRAERLGLARDDPQHDEAPEEPRRQGAFEERPRDGRSVFHWRHARHRQGLLGLGEIEGRGRRRRVREEDEAVEGNWQRDLE